MLIIAATLLVYWPALRNGFVWDDTALVLRDPLIRSWRLIPEGFRHFLFLDATASEFYRPVQRLSFVFDYQLYGLAQPWGWHLTSILVHAGAAVALFFAVEKLLAALAPGVALTGQRTIACGTALLWAIHPLHTSAVTYVAGRADPLAALFGFTALALGLIGVRGRPTGRLRRNIQHPMDSAANAKAQLRESFAKTENEGKSDAGDADERESHGGDPSGSQAESESDRASWIWTFGAAACFLLAMLSKESGIIFLPIWLVLLAWRRETRPALIRWLLIAAVVVAAYGGWRFSSDKVPPPPPPATPAAIRPILAARAIAEYAGLLVAPVTLRMERDVSTRRLDRPEETLRMARAREYETLAGVLLVIGLGVWIGYCFRQVPAAAFALTAFAVAYLPISNLFSLNATIAEHWLYVPSAFLILAAFLTGAHVLPRTTARLSSFPLIGVGALGLCWVVLLGLRTFRRQADWHDPRTFIERTMAAGGNSPRMMMNLANVEFSDGHPEAAINLYREALRRAPDQSVIWMGYATVLLRQHDFAGASEALGHAEKSPFLAADAGVLRAAIENADSGRDPGELLRNAVALAPKNWGIRKRYIEYLHDSGKPQEAMRELQGLLKNAGFRAESWRMLGTLLEEAHQPAMAIEAYREAAMRDVRDTESRAKIAAAAQP